MLSLDRRYGYRLPLEMYLSTYVADRPTRGFTSNLSATGLYLNTLTHEPLPARTPMGLEFNLPGASETIWAAGEACYDEPDDYLNGIGIRFVAMAGLHERMLQEYLREARRERYRRARRSMD
jgi:hypothetical protein